MKLIATQEEKVDLSLLLYEVQNESIELALRHILFGGETVKDAIEAVMPERNGKQLFRFAAGRVEQ